jgi:hypothetical protein
LPKLPPPVNEERFKELEGATEEQVEKRAESFVSELHSFLNRDSCLRDIQRIRREWVPAAKKQSAFQDFATESEHWYTYNIGGRNEAQFNIGLFPTYLRVGLGFELTKQGYGQPQRVQSIYKSFCQVVNKYRPGFEKFFRDDKLQVEWRPAGKQKLEYVGSEDAVDWLTGPQGASADWILVGRLLYRHEDFETLKRLV